MDFEGNYTRKGQKGDKGDTGATGATGATGPAGKDAQLYDYRGEFGVNETISAKQYDAFFSDLDNQIYYKSTAGSGNVSCPPNSDFTLLDNQTGSAISNTNPYASIYVLDATLPIGVSYYSGVFNINVLGSGDNIGTGFVNDAGGLLTLDTTNLNGKQGNYLINYTLSLTCDNITSSAGIGIGEVAILKIRDGNTIYGRRGIGGYYANKPPYTGASSIYNTITGSVITDLKFGDKIGLQALNILITNQYKYNLSYTISYLSPLTPENYYSDHYIGIYDSTTHQFNFNNITTDVYDIPLMFNNDVEYSYSSNLQYLNDDLPNSLNPNGLNNSYKYCYYKFINGEPNPETLSIQCYSRINLSGVNWSFLSTLFQYSVDGISWTDLDEKIVINENFNGDKILNVYWVNNYTPSQTITQYVRPILRVGVVSDPALLNRMDIASTSFNIVPVGSLAPLINISTNTIDASTADNVISCSTSVDSYFSLPIFRKLPNPNSIYWNGGCNNVYASYTPPVDDNQNILAQTGLTVVSPNPAQNYNIVSSFSLNRFTGNTENWVCEVIEGSNSYSIHLTFDGSGNASVNINDTVTLNNPTNDIIINIVNLNAVPLSFTLIDYILSVVAV